MRSRLATGVAEEGLQLSRRTFLLGTAALAAGTGCGSNGSTVPRRGDSDARGPHPDLYACEGCEGALERSPASLGAQTRIAPPGEPGEPMRVEGTVYHADGATPAPGVVIYAYQTDSGGLYSRGTPETEASRRHGLLRGWVRTGPDGHYRFDTVKPGPYPREDIPAHIHLTVLEPNRPPYWIDDIVFAGEHGVTEQYRRERENRGGNGIVVLARQDGMLIARRDIVLERHPR